MVIRAAVLALVLAACGEISPHRCVDDTGCAIGGEQGTCTLYHHCAFQDPECVYGRYHESAGSLAGKCVTEEGLPRPDCVPQREICGDREDSDCSGDGGDADPPCPDGDRPDSPRHLELAGFLRLNTRFAENNVTLSCGNTAGRDLFFELELAQPRRYYLDTYGSELRTALAAFKGPCAARMQELGCTETAHCGDDVLRYWTGNLDPGTYCFVVDQLDPDPEATSPSWLYLFYSSGPPSVDISAGVLYAADTCMQSSELGTCQLPGTPTEHSAFMLTCGGTLVVSTCDASPSFDGYVEAFGVFGNQLGCAAGCDAGAGLRAPIDWPQPVWISVEASLASACETAVYVRADIEP